MERQSLANLHILGSKMGDCAMTARYRLSDYKEGDSKLGTAKYRCGEAMGEEGGYVTACLRLVALFTT